MSCRGGQESCTSPAKIFIVCAGFEEDCRTTELETFMMNARWSSGRELLQSSSSSACQRIKNKHVGNKSASSYRTWEFRFSHVKLTRTHLDLQLPPEGHMNVICIELVGGRSNLGVSHLNVLISSR